jgi:uncharacterized protein YjbJ (UPF0337 family)
MTNQINLEFTRSKKMNNTGTIKEEAGGMKDRVVGNIKDAAGSMTNNPDLERRGEAQANQGQMRQENNDVVSDKWMMGSFNDRSSAEKAYGSLKERGYTEDDVNILMSDEARNKHFSDYPNTELGNKALEGAGTGSAIGGTIGAVLAGIAAIGTSVALPGLGLIVAGPLVAALAGAGAGGLTGGLVGALVGYGIPEEEAQKYEQDIQNGNIVMGVKPRNSDDYNYYESEWKNNRY